MGEAWNARARSFDDRAAQYDDVRPGYPAEAVSAILGFGGLEPGARALEVGSGTGKATRLLLARGLEVTCLEPGSQLLDVARRACAGAVRFRRTRFEDWPLEPDAYDLVFAAQSFHWVDPEMGYRKAGEALRRGGTLALFWNRSRTRPSPLQARLEELYERRAPGLEELTPEVLARVEEAISACIERTNLFAAPERRGFPWSDRVTTRRYVALLETYSAYATLPEAQRRSLLEGVAELVDAAGGEIDLHYETIVHLARRA